MPVFKKHALKWTVRSTVSVERASYECPFSQSNCGIRGNAKYFYTLSSFPILCREIFFSPKGINKTSLKLFLAILNRGEWVKYVIITT